MTATSISLRPDRLRLESLEDRCVPAFLGQPWSDPERLTLSFAPERTAIAGHQSNLYATLDAQLGRATWQRLVLQAFQTWAIQSNINIGLVRDTGDPFGVPGRTQSDTRFGDIRIGAQAMVADALAVTVPHDPHLSGTWAGDVFFNNMTRYVPSTLFPVIMHEVGHVLGLDESTDPRSVMYPVLSTSRPFTAQDLTQVQELYGRRIPDLLEGRTGNETFATATRIKYSENSDGYAGRTPLVLFGDLTTTRDIDTYWVKPLTGYTGSMTFRLQTAGLSFLAPRITIFDQFGRVLTQAASTSWLGSTLVVRLPNVVPDQPYFVRVTSAVGDVFGMGRYGLVVTFDRNLVTTPQQIETFLRQAPTGLGQVDDDVLRDLANPLLKRDLGGDDTVLTAQKLTPLITPTPGTRFEVIGSIETTTDVDYYRLRSPRLTDNLPLVLTASVNNAALNGIVPIIQIFDANQSPVTTQVLVNGNGTFTVQSTGLEQNKDYYLRIFSPTGQTGNYLFEGDYGIQATTPKGFAIGTVNATQRTNSYRLFVGHSQLMQFTLSATSPIAGTTSTVRFDLRNAQGQVVLTLRSRNGETNTLLSQFLVPGPYSVEITLEPGVGGQFDPMNYRLIGISLSRPIGPAISDPLLTPQYLSPNDPTLFLYPGEWSSRDPYFWVLFDPAGWLLIPGAPGTPPLPAFPVIDGIPLRTRP